MIQSLTSEQISSVLREILAAGLFPENHPALIVHDVTVLQERAESILRAFPPGTLHTVAVKANPLPGVLSELRHLGFGAEAASAPELEIAFRTGFDPGSIVYDSPVKRHEEIGDALRRGVLLNADSFGELTRIATILAGRPPRQPIGLRVNPQVGRGGIPDTGTAGAVSKFGVPLDDAREEILSAFERFPWLSGLHVHVGSQGCPLELLTEGVRRTVECGEELRAHLRARGGTVRPVRIDIGGGIPVPYNPGERRPGVEEYRAMLDRACPELFSFDVVTEFGRYIHANAGWAASRVEYVKRAGESTIALVHLGADMFLRRAYRPDVWFHGISLFTPKGELKQGTVRPVTIAGPLCFSGDVLAHDIPLPSVDEGDIVVIHDAGAYTLSMWSRYNSRQIPRILACGGPAKGMSIVREREQPDDVWRFWA